MTAIYCDNSLTTPETIETNGFVICYYTQCATEKSPPNQDALLVTPVDPHTVVLAVADGVGGCTAGHLAARRTVDDLDQMLTTLSTPISDIGELRNNIISTIEQTNHALVTDGGQKQTTLTLCILHKQQYCTLQIGDSGLLHCSLRGKLKYRTIMQSPVGYAVQAGMLSAAEGQQHPDNHFVDNVVGEKEMSIEIGAIHSLARYDTLLLASDGLFDNVLDDDIIQSVRRGKLNKVTQHLADCCQKGLNPIKSNPFIKDDDVSFIVCRLSNAP